MSERVVSSFWDHLEVLRKVLFRCLIAWLVGAVAAFCFKNLLFGLLFAPSRDDFISYQGLTWLCEKTGWQSLCPGSFQASFINTELAAQFMTHIKVALGARLRSTCVIREGETSCCTHHHLGHPALHARRADELLHHLPFRLPFPQRIPSVRRGEKPDLTLVLHLQPAHAQPADGHPVRDPHRQPSPRQGGTITGRYLEEIPPPRHRGHRHRGGRHHPHRRCSDTDASHLAHLSAI